MKVSEMVTEIQNLTVSGTDITDAMLHSWIKEGWERVVGMYEWPFTNDHVESSVAVSTNPIYTEETNSRWGTVKSVIDNADGLELIYLEEGEVERRWGSLINAGGDASARVLGGRPMYYTVLYETGVSGPFARIYVIPDPDQTREFLISLVRYTTFDETDNDETPEWQDIYHRVLVLWACQRVWEREEDFERASYYRNQFNDMVNEMGRYYAVKSKGGKVYGEFSDEGRFNGPIKSILYPTTGGLKW